MPVVFESSQVSGTQCVKTRFVSGGVKVNPLGKFDLAEVVRKQWRSLLPAGAGFRLAADANARFYDPVHIGLVGIRIYRADFHQVRSGGPVRLAIAFHYLYLPSVVLLVWIHTRRRQVPPDEPPDYS